MDFANCPADESFGPAVVGCRDDFDFTLKFELLFTIIPAAIFLVLAIPRLCIIVTIALHVSLLVLSTQGGARFKLSSLFISAQVLALSAALATAVLSHSEHRRSHRPSMLLDIFLGLTILLDIAHDRTLWLSSSSKLDTIFVRVFTAAVAVKAVLIVLESRAKLEGITVTDEKIESLDGGRGIYSLSTFAWLSGLFLSGYKRVLSIEDLPALDENMAVDTLQAQFAKRTKKYLGKSTKEAPQHNLRLLRALGDTLAVPLLLPIVPRIVLIGFTVSQAFLIQSVLDFLDDEEAPIQEGYGLIGAAILIYAGIAGSTSLYWYYHERALYMTRGCLSSSIFLKTTQLSEATVSTSQAVTLMSTDVDRILTGFLNLHDLWASLIQAALGCWLLWSHLGSSFIIPIGLVVASFLAVATLGRYVGGYQKVWMQETQRRVAMTANILANMKHLKISGLATAVEEAIQRVRLTELRASRGLRRIQIVAMVISLSPELIAPSITFAATSRDLNSSTVFTVVALLSLVTAPLGQLFKSVAPLMSALACLDRIQTYLELEPRADFRGIGQPDEEKPGPYEHQEDANTRLAVSEEPRHAALRVVRGNFGWQKDGPYCLRDVNLAVEYSKLTMVVGPVGSGKSTLCKALVGETPIWAGQVLVGGGTGARIAYCDQTPFLSNNTIRDNIVGASVWDPERYAEVIEATGLSRDLDEFVDGDSTLVGSNGLILSGGQKQRVAIARAIYLDARILIFDDVLSGVDAKTEDHVFRHVFGPGGLLKRRRSAPAVILCTHSVMHLPEADHIVVLGKQGDVVEQGIWEVVAHSKGHMQNLGVREDGPEDGAKPVPERSAAAMPQVGPSPRRPATREPRGSAVDGLTGATRMRGDFAVYRHYFKAVSVVALIAFVASALTYGFFFAFPTVWLKFWVKDSDSTNPSHTKAFWIGIYGLFQALALLGVLLALYLAVTFVSLVSGAALHLSVLQAVMKARLSLFATADVGTLTNYFSQDMALIDGELPVSLINFATDLAISLSMAGVLASSSPYMAASYPVVIMLLYAVAKFYLRTSRQLRLLDLEAKSPLYAHFLDTGRGIATIRAARLAENCVSQNQQFLDASQRPAYLLAMIQHWLLFMLNVFVLFLAVLTVTLVTRLRDQGTGFAGPGLVTLLQLGQIMATTVRSYAKLETSMGAVHRLKALSENTVSEVFEGESMEAPISWPSSGRIHFNRVSASYSDVVNSSDDVQVSLALKDLTLVIEPGQKVALCGRTGSGKSSLILLLLRLLDPLPTSPKDAISIDGLPLQDIGRSVLCQRIIAVPQEAIFLPAGTSWKENLDLFGTCTNAECRSVLEDVNLWDSVKGQSGGLTAAMKPGELSQGQKQLFSLVRAVLRKRIKDREKRQAASVIGGVEAPPIRQPRENNETGGSDWDGSADAVERQTSSSSLSETKLWYRTSATAGEATGILLLDEVNSSMDLDTERRFYNIIRREFSDYTVLMVTHRLSFIAGKHNASNPGLSEDGPEEFFDRVIVLDSGTIVEDGSPAKLLQVRSGRFRALCEAVARGNET
ncbi:hypothetical protein G7Z17_g7235 [Cylindrodendrum hubeiense]|uniref:ABC transporter n=1 Tax=Cylindrodendrum hubeiense TaxID=595255 RepID=A0A9P5LFI3_9HYPO|nr:hypothetical protein G7Z17_g7235 [Cylindrodendrum hubeiense]